MARRRRLHRRYRKNPDSGIGSADRMALTEVWNWVGPGFAAFAAGRFVTYVLTGQVEKRKPAWGKHAGAVAAVTTFAGSWLLAHKVKFLSKYVEPIVIGTGLAAAASLVQLYVPKLGWMIGDPNTAAQDATAQAVAGAQASLPPGFSVVDEDPTSFEYNDAHDAGIYGAQAPTGQPNQAQAQEDDILVDLDLDDAAGAGVGGIFAGN